MKERLSTALTEEESKQTQGEATSHESLNNLHRELEKLSIGSDPYTQLIFSLHAFQQNHKGILANAIDQTITVIIGLIAQPLELLEWPKELAPIVKDNSKIIYPRLYINLQNENLNDLKLTADDALFISFNKLLSRLRELQQLLTDTPDTLELNEEITKVILNYKKYQATLCYGGIAERCACLTPQTRILVDGKYSHYLSPKTSAEIFNKDKRKKIVLTIRDEARRRFVGPYQNIYFKTYPDCQSGGDAVDIRNEVLTKGYNPSKLIKIERTIFSADECFFEDNFPQAEISTKFSQFKKETISFSISLTINASNFHDIKYKDPKFKAYLQQNGGKLPLHPEGFSTIILFSLRFDPYDGAREDNYMAKVVTPPSNNPSLTYFPVDIDHDLGFAHSVVKRPDDQHTTNIRCFFYFQPQMQQPFDPAVGKRILSFSPELAAIKWLDDLAVKEKEYDRLRKTGLLTENEFKALRLPSCFCPGTVVKYYQRDCLIQQLLRDTQQGEIFLITHMELLKKVDPILWAFYEGFQEVFSSRLDIATQLFARQGPDEKGNDITFETISDKTANEEIRTILLDARKKAVGPRDYRIKRTQTILEARDELFLNINYPAYINALYDKATQEKFSFQKLAEKHYRQLKEPARKLFITTVKTLLVTMDNRDVEKKQIFSELHARLKNIPNSIGIRASVLEGRKQWEETITSLLDDENSNNTNEYKVSIFCDADLNNIHIKQGVLKSSVAEQLFDKNTGERLLRDNKLLGRDWIRAVYSSKNESDQPIVYVSFRKCPGKNIAEERLIHRLSGLANFSTLVFCEVYNKKTKQKEVTPLLFSSPAGQTLQHVYENEMDDGLVKIGKQLDPYSYTHKVLETVVIGKEDDKPDNIALRKTRIDNHEFYQFISFDNNHGFLLYPIIKSTLLLREVVQLKSQTLFFDLMNEKLDLNCVDDYCHYDINALMKDWLAELTKLDNSIKKLFEEQINFLANKSEESDFCFIPISLEPESAGRLWGQLTRLRNLITGADDEPLPADSLPQNHFELVSYLEPQATIFFQKYYQMENTPAARFNAFSKNCTEYKQIAVTGQTPSNANSPQFFKLIRYQSVFGRGRNPQELAFQSITSRAQKNKKDLTLAIKNKNIYSPEDSLKEIFNLSHCFDQIEKTQEYLEFGEPQKLRNLISSLQLNERSLGVIDVSSMIEKIITNLPWNKLQLSYEIVLMSINSDLSETVKFQEIKKLTLKYKNKPILIKQGEQISICGLNGEITALNAAMFAHLNFPVEDTIVKFPFIDKQMYEEIAYQVGYIHENAVGSLYEYQKNILNEVATLPFRRLILKNIDGLTDALLKTIINNSPDLVEIVIDNCRNITPAVINYLSQHKTLEKLTLKNLPQFDKIKIEFLWGHSFPRLRRLHLENNLNLTEFVIRASLLEILWVSNCPALANLSTQSMQLMSIELNRVLQLQEKQLAHLASDFIYLQRLLIINCPEIEYISFYQKYPFLLSLPFHEYSPSMIASFNETLDKVIPNPLLLKLLPVKRCLLENLKPWMNDRHDYDVIRLIKNVDQSSRPKSNSAPKPNPELIEQLLKKLKSPDKNTRLLAIKSLGLSIEIIPENSRGSVIGALLGEIQRWDNDIRAAAIQALGNCAAFIMPKSLQECVIGILLAHLQDTNYSVREHTIIALGQCAAFAWGWDELIIYSKIIKSLLHATQSKEKQLRILAIGALEKYLLRHVSKELQECLLEGLCIALQDEESDVRQAAMKLLMQYPFCYPIFSDVIEDTIDKLLGIYQQGLYWEEAAQVIGKLIPYIDEDSQRRVAGKFSNRLQDLHFYKMDSFYLEMVASGLEQCVSITPKIQLYVDLIGLQEGYHKFLHANVITPSLKFTVRALSRYLIEFLNRASEYGFPDLVIAPFLKNMFTLINKKENLYFENCDAAVEALGYCARGSSYFSTREKEKVIKNLLFAMTITQEHSLPIKQSAIKSLGQWAAFIPQSSQEQIVKRLLAALKEPELQEAAAWSIEQYLPLLSQSLRKTVIETLLPEANNNDSVAKKLLVTLFNFPTLEAFLKTALDKLQLPIITTNISKPSSSSQADINNNSNSDSQQNKLRLSQTFLSHVAEKEEVQTPNELLPNQKKQ